MHFLTAFALFFLVHLSTPLQADWNEDFDRTSAFLTQSIPTFQHIQYQKQYSEFKKIREKLVHDKDLIKKLQATALYTKVLITKKELSIIIKKRKNHHIHDLYPWEMSYLLESNAYITPSFPMEIGGVRVIVQKLEPFEFGNKYGGGYSKGTIKKISLETYWKSHLQAYILGLSDLAVSNIGINKKGIIRFFDNEACLIYYNTALNKDTYFSSGFMCQSYDWPQFDTPLDEATAHRLQEYIHTFINLENKLRAYFSIRVVTFPFDQLQYRIRMVQNFKIQKGISFRDFFAVLFPDIEKGFDELHTIVSDMLQRRAGYGTSLFYASRYIKRNLLPEKTKTRIKEWVHTYITH